MSDKVCFFICPLGEAGSEQRERSDQVEEYIIKPIAHGFGYVVVRADKIGKPGIITSQVIEHLFESSLVIADLAFQNPNVFYELALRHAVRKPFIQLIEDTKRIPFDVSSLRTIQLDHHDLASAERCKSELEKQISEIERNPTLVESPVSHGIEVQSLKSSGKQTDRVMGEILESVSEVSRQMRQLKGLLFPDRPAVMTASNRNSEANANILRGTADPAIAAELMAQWSKMLTSSGISGTNPLSGLAGPGAAAPKKPK
jgi:hypothetical protein